MKTAEALGWNYASVFICGLSGLFVTFIIGSYYGPATLGAFNIVYAFYIILSQVAAFGVHHSVLKHVAEFAEDKAVRRVAFSTGLAATVPLALIVSLCLWGLRWPIAGLMQSPSVAQGLAWAALGLFFFALNKVLLAALNALSRLKEYAVYMSLRFVFMIGSLLLLMAFSQPAEKIAMLLPAAEIALFVLLMLALLNELRKTRSFINREWVHRHVGFGIRGFGGNLLMDLNTRVDVLCLGLFVNDRIVGIYSMAAILAEAIYQLPLVLRTVYNTRVIQMLATGAYGALQVLIGKTRVMVWAGMGLAGLVGVITYPHIIPLISGRPEYSEGTIIFGVIMAGMVFASGYVPFGMLLANAGRPGLQTVKVFLLIVINITGNFLLIPFLGSLGAALATAGTHIFSVILLKYYCKRFLQLIIVLLMIL
jgi:O-antigen/teichoic acid export membrane protein